MDLALRTLVVPEHSSAFWDEVAQRLADEPQLRLRPRAAVRPITQPPPVIDDRLPFDDGDVAVRRGGPRRARRRRRALVVGVALALAAVLAIGIAQGQPERNEDARTDATTTTVPPTTAAPGVATTVAPSPVDPAAGLSPNGVDELLVGRTMRDLTASGVVVQVDRPTFDGSGGTCFDGRAQGVDDVVLRFRSPDPGVGVADPAEGVLASVIVDTRAGSARRTSAGIGLGATTDQVRAAYPEGLEEANHPFTVGGLILTIAGGDDSGNGIAFMTDGNAVTSIAAGTLDVIRIPDGCS